MKTTILLTLGLMIFTAGFTQNYNGLTFVPKGSFTVQEAGAPRTISVDNFWMSNEITNKEFREFYNQIKSSPNDSVSWIDISGSKDGKMGKPIVISKAYSAIVDKLMDESAWKSVVEKGDYFTNPNYDKYPVVGVTWEGARYYCIWRTNQESKKLGKQGKQMTTAYRLPTENEWEYAFSFTDPKSSTVIKELHPIDKGDKNKIGLFNLNSNVAEWTSTSAHVGYQVPMVVEGSSWKTDSKGFQYFVLPDKGSDYIGFRIVISEEKK